MGLSYMRVFSKYVSKRDTRSRLIRQSALLADIRIKILKKYTIYHIIILIIVIILYYSRLYWYMKLARFMGLLFVLWNALLLVSRIWTFQSQKLVDVNNVYAGEKCQRDMPFAVTKLNVRTRCIELNHLGGTHG